MPRSFFTPRLLPALLPLVVGFAPAARAHDHIPHVATDIAPVHALVAQVMQGVGTPDLILPPGASPHGYSMRPSEAAALADADLVIWVGPTLTPWLEKSLDTIASGAARLTLTESGVTTQLPNRESAVFGDEDHHEDDHQEAHEKDHDGEHKSDHDDHDMHETHDDHDKDHADDHDAEHEKDHDDHKDGAHEEDHDADHDEKHGDDHDKDHADHDAEHSDGHDHDHAAGAMDPHVWLDPVNAQMWLGVIADQLAERDPEHADVYLANAQAAREGLDALIADTRQTLTPLADTRFVVFHDAYQYFEARFGLKAAGAISLGDASRPSPARIATLRDAVKDGQISCALAEPQYNSGLIDTVFEGTDVSTQVIDPLGAALTPGPELYTQLLRGMVDSFVGCVK